MAFDERSAASICSLVSDKGCRNLLLTAVRFSGDVYEVTFSAAIVRLLRSESARRHRRVVE